MAIQVVTFEELSSVAIDVASKNYFNNRDRLSIINQITLKLKISLPLLWMTLSQGNFKINPIGGN